MLLVAPNIVWPNPEWKLSWSLLNNDWEVCFTPSTCRKTILPRPYYPEFRKNREANTTNNDGFFVCKNTKCSTSSILLRIYAWIQKSTTSMRRTWIPKTLWTNFPPGQDAAIPSALAAVIPSRISHEPFTTGVAHLWLAHWNSKGCRSFEWTETHANNPNAQSKIRCFSKKSHLRTDSTREIIFWHPGLPTFFFACLSCQWYNYMHHFRKRACKDMHQIFWFYAMLGDFYAFRFGKPTGIV